MLAWGSHLGTTESMLRLGWRAARLCFPPRISRGYFVVLTKCPCLTTASQAGNKDEEYNAWRQKALVPALGKVAKKLSPSFIVSTGDNFYEYGIADADDVGFKRSFTDVYDAEAHPSLDLPWYVILGNHDYQGDPAAQISARLRERDGRWRLPAPAFALKRLGDASTSTVDIFFIDTNIFIGTYRMASDPGGNPYKTAGRNDHTARCPLARFFLQALCVRRSWGAGGSGWQQPEARIPAFCPPLPSCLHSPGVRLDDAGMRPHCEQRRGPAVL